MHKYMIHSPATVFLIVRKPPDTSPRAASLNILLHVLVAYLLLHLGVGQRVQEGGPEVRLALVAEGILHGRHLVLGGDIALAVVGRCWAAGVEDHLDELSTHPEVDAQPLGEVLRVVLFIQVPLELVNLHMYDCIVSLHVRQAAHQTDASNVNVEFYDDPLGFLLLAGVLDSSQVAAVCSHQR